MQNVDYIETFLPEDIKTFCYLRQSKLTSKIAIESLSGFNKISSQAQIAALNNMIDKISFFEVKEVYAPAANYALFDNYFRIRRIQSRNIEAAIKSHLLAFRSAIIDAQQNGSQLPHDEWQQIMRMLPLIVGKILDQDNTDITGNQEEALAQ
ncbi:MULTISPECIES: hypothetical protein [unclassified Halomonas]|uniref:hypothetical protein n=1 Tax=unclassified Halomonas TaxID=2609666 RepID=UPI0006D9F2CC|nr:MULTISPECIES: hypothetical protein [unclassified Halomonas]KPQ22566.1 MAG: hypothetical protein HLUCCO06_07210 [Halomonas sp. HL-93]SBR45821.1 hypothetical protein GA0071314_0421 [Halomonas sp. HL-93]SNY98464.1 hypothetical protein SAMN04488142_3086 [Halomonas sp. hl-4]